MSAQTGADSTRELPRQGQAAAREVQQEKAAAASKRAKAALEQRSSAKAAATHGLPATFEVCREWNKTLTSQAYTTAAHYQYMNNVLIASVQEYHTDSKPACLPRYLPALCATQVHVVAVRINPCARKPSHTTNTPQSWGPCDSPPPQHVPLAPRFAPKQTPPCLRHLLPTSRWVPRDFLSKTRRHHTSGPLRQMLPIRHALPQELALHQTPGPPSSCPAGAQRGMGEDGRHRAARRAAAAAAAARRSLCCHRWCVKAPKCTL